MAIAALISSAIRQRNDRVIISSENSHVVTNLFVTTWLFSLFHGVARGMNDSSPTYLNKGNGLTRQRKAQLDLAVFAIYPFGRREQRKLSGGLELRVLLRRGVLRRTQLLPKRIGVAALLINAVVTYERAPGVRRQAVHRQTHWRIGRRQIVVMVIPHHRRDLAFSPRRQGVHVRLAARARFQDRLQVDRTAAFDL